MLVSGCIARMHDGATPQIVPQIVQARLDRNVWFVPVRLNGRTAEFVLSTTVSRSVIDPDFAGGDGGRLPTLHIGDVAFVAPSFPRKTTFGAKGIFGADVLRDRLIGFDFESGQLAIWPKGTRIESARAWIAALPDVRGTRIQSLGVLQSGVPTIPIRLGDAPGRLRLSSALTGLSLQRERAKSDVYARATTTRNTDGLTAQTKDLEEGIAGPIAFGGGKARYIGAVVEDAPYDEKVDGAVPMVEIGSRRAVLDLGGRRLLVEDQDADAELSSSLGAVLGVPVAIGAGRLTIGATRDARTAELLAPFVGNPIVSVAGRKADEITAALGEGGVRALQLLATLRRVRATGYVIEVETGLGRRTIQVAAED